MEALLWAGLALCCFGVLWKLAMAPYLMLRAFEPCYPVAVTVVIKVTIVDAHGEMVAEGGGYAAVEPRASSAVAMRAMVGDITHGLAEARVGMALARRKKR